MKRQNKRYSSEFRAEAVKMVLEQDLSQEDAATRLAMPKGTLGKWMTDAKSAPRSVAPGSRSVAELEVENATLRKALAEARLERDILKKATAYFAKESQPGTRS